MPESGNSGGSLKPHQIKWHALVLAVFWTLAVLSSVGWGVLTNNQETEDLARSAARIAIEKDVIYRQWNAERAGVYVPITASTRPNPHLKHMPERDVTTLSGKRLTLVNPAYMTRQAHELGRKRFNVYGHITSLRPIRKKNEPDPWERLALLQFERGSKEETTYAEIAGERHLRLMLPLVTERSCLKCHARSGYKEGDIGGGISVTVPMTPYMKTTSKHRGVMMVGHAALWLIGLLGLALGSVHIRRRIVSWEESQAALEQSRKQMMEDQKLKAVGHLAGGVAHDFNNLLTVMLGSSQFAQESLAEDHPAQEDLADIQKASQRATELTRQLLAFSRRQVLEPRIVDLNQIVREMASMLERVIGEHIIFAVELDQEGCFAEVDPGQMERVIMNLTLNARDALPSGGRISIMTGRIKFGGGHRPVPGAQIPDGDYMVLTLADNGTGMDEETRRHIFEPFFSTKDRTKGTGLGLAMAYGIVRQSQGWSLCASTPGEGSTFSIYLPWAEAPLAPTPDPAMAEDDLSAAVEERILLLAEDEKVVRQVLKRILENAGYKVQAARSGEQALEIYNSMPETIDLLVTDVVMPGMSGLDLAQQILKLRPGFKVLFLSGYAADDLPSGRRPDPAQSLLQKPVSREVLLSAGRELLAVK